MARGRQNNWWQSKLAPLLSIKLDKYIFVATIVALLVAMPIIFLFIIALNADFNSLAHIATSILPKATLTTIILLFGLAILTGLIGSLSAWLVTFFDFPFRKIFAWALVLPLAVPTYISAYAFVEFLSFTGPIQSILREIFGFSSLRDYYFPDIRSLGGAIFILSFVLYPYVYLSVRALFYLQGKRAIEAGEVLGATQRSILIKILLPLARPALALGVILVMMEAINDIGAMEYLGVKTLTLSIFSIWINQGDFAGAAQIALVLLLVVFALIIFERMARRGQSFSEVGKGSANSPFVFRKLSNFKKILAFIACFIPVAFGFGVPFFILAYFALRSLKNGFDPMLITATITSVSLASVAAIITVIIAIFLSYAVRIGQGKLIKSLVRIASTGYAMPGTIIALGILFPLANFDNFVDFYMRQWFGISTGLLISGSAIILIYAYVVRFMAIGEGSIAAGFEKIPKSLDMAASLYGKSRFVIFIKILLPLMKPAIITAFLLVFIDSLKELSATLMLRPFGVETLSIYIHDLASRGRIEQASVAAIIIMIVGIIPVILLNRAIQTK